MRQLATAVTADEVIEVLGELGRARRGAAEELAYLADHPDPHVRDTLLPWPNEIERRLTGDLRLYPTRVAAGKVEVLPVGCDLHGRLT
jgi:hypothetical protein